MNNIVIKFLEYLKANLNKQHYIDFAIENIKGDR